MKPTTLLISLVLASCSKGGAPAHDAAPTTSRLEVLQREWTAAIDEANKKTYERPPLFPPGEKGAAADVYREAIKASFPSQLETAEGESELAGWSQVSAALKTYAASPAAKNIADHILRGASMSDGTTPAPDGDAAMKVSRARPAVTVRLVALERAAAGKPLEGCKYLLGLVRFGQDMARGSVLLGAMVGRGFELQAAQTLRMLVTDHKLSVAELHEVLDGLTRLTGTRVLPGQTLRSEIRWLAGQLMADTTRAGEMGLTPEAALAQLKQHSAIAEDLDAIDGDSLAKREAFFTGKSCKLKGYEKQCKSMTKYIRALASRDASLEATRTYVALELYRRTHRRKTANKLEDLIPDTLPAMPINPLTGDAFGYEDSGAGKLIRVSDDKASTGTALPATIPAPGSRARGG